MQRAVAEVGLDLLQRGHITRDALEGDDAAAFGDRHDAVLGPQDRAVAPHHAREERLHLTRGLARPRLRRHRLHAGSVLRVEDAKEQRGIGIELFGLVAEHGGGGGVDVLEVQVGQDADAEDHVGGVLGEEPEPLLALEHLGARGALVGDVDERGDRIRDRAVPIAHGPSGDEQPDDLAAAPPFDHTEAEDRARHVLAVAEGAHDGEILERDRIAAIVGDLVHDVVDACFTAEALGHREEPTRRSGWSRRSGRRSP